MADDSVETSFVAFKNYYLLTQQCIQILKSNTSRVRYVIQNDIGTIYIGLGSPCSPFNFSYRIAKYGVLEDDFQGAIYACVAQGTGLCFVTEEV